MTKPNSPLAALEAAPHVNETPKSEHDAGNVLTVPDLVVEAGKVDFDAIAYGFWSIHPRDIPKPVGMPEAYKGGARAWHYANTMRQAFAPLIARIAAQQAQIAGLNACIEQLQGPLTVAALTARAEAAEAEAATLRAEVERLRGGLKKINVGEGWAAQIARAALEGKA